MSEFQDVRETQKRVFYFEPINPIDIDDFKNLLLENADASALRGATVQFYGSYLKISCTQAVWLNSLINFFHKESVRQFVCVKDDEVEPVEGVRAAEPARHRLQSREVGERCRDRVHALAGGGKPAHTHEHQLPPVEYERICDAEPRGREQRRGAAGDGRQSFLREGQWF